MTVLAFFLASVQVLPFGSVVEPPTGSAVSYYVDGGDPNKGAVTGPYYFDGEPVVPAGTKWAQALPKGSMGWHDGIFPVVDGTVKLDKEQSLGSPVYDYSKGKFVPAYWLFWSRNPYGTWKDLVWGKAALTVKGSRLTVYATVVGSPWQSVDVVGSNNSMLVDVRPGVQSRLIQDLASCRSVGSSNRWSGYVESPMCALWMKGPNAYAIDMVLRGGSYGDDVGVFYLGRESDGMRATNVDAVAEKRAYPPSHGFQLYYLDDKSGGAVLYNCAAYGSAMRGVFVHGGSNVRVERFRSLGQTDAIVFARHFQTPTVEPTGNLALSVVKS